MVYRTSLVQLDHDDAVRASARTYGEMEKKGYKVGINPDGEKNVSVNSHYPDVVVWKPDAIGLGKGKTEIIEEIETADSVTDIEAEQWKAYGSLGVKFLLIVPKGYESETKALASRKGANVSEFWVYYTENGTIKFART